MAHIDVNRSWSVCRKQRREGGCRRLLDETGLLDPWAAPVGELLICCRCLGIQPEPFHSAGWELLFSCQMPDGDLPSPTSRIEALPEEREEAAEARFRANYHPTLVALIATFVEETTGGGF